MTGKMPDQDTYNVVYKVLGLVLNWVVAFANIAYFSYLHQNYNNNACYMFLKIESILTSICQIGT